MVALNAGDVEIEVTIGVDVTSADANAPAETWNARALRHVGESAAAVAAVKPATRLLRRFCRGDRQTVDQEEVERTVVVEIEQGHAARYRLEDVALFLGMRSTKIDAGAIGNVFKFQVSRPSVRRLCPERRAPCTGRRQASDGYAFANTQAREGLGQESPPPDSASPEPFCFMRPPDPEVLGAD